MENNVLNDGHSFHVDMPNYQFEFSISVPNYSQNNSVLHYNLLQFVVTVN